MGDVSLRGLIAPVFYPVHADIRQGAHSDYWLHGGRGSGKSSFVSLEIALGLMRDPEANAVIYRRVADTLRESVYAQMLWALDRLNVTHLWQSRLSPMELVYRPTGQLVLFRGADDPQKSKGIKLQKGFFRYLWFEELAEFPGMEPVHTIKASVIRGSGALTFYTYNPPMTAANWVNREALKSVPGRLTHRSDYRDVPPEWLGETFLANAEAMRLQNERAYRHMYLGEVTGTGGQVFTNLCLRAIRPEEWQGLPTYSGLDFGFSVDPDTLARCAFSRKRRVLYVVREFAARGMQMEALAPEVNRRVDDDVVTCDNEDPRSIAGLRARRVRAIAARKGPDSVNHGMKWLQTLAAIVIDPAVCPFAAKEFSEYEYERDKSGEIIPRYPDKNNHSIDAVRYAMESVSGQRTAIVPK